MFSRLLFHASSPRRKDRRPLVVEALDKRTQPAVLTHTSSAVANVLDSSSLTNDEAVLVEQAALAPKPNAANPADVRSAKLGPNDANAVRFPAADAVLAATHQAAPDSPVGLLPAVAANSTRVDRLDLPSEGARGIMAADQNLQLAAQTNVPAFSPVPAEMGAASSIPVAGPQAPPAASPLGEALASVVAVGEIPLNAASAAVLAPIGAPSARIPEAQEALVNNLVSEQSSNESIRPGELSSAGMHVPWQPQPDISFATMDLASRPADDRIYGASDARSERHFWPVLPAAAAVWELWYRGNQT